MLKTQSLRSADRARSIIALGALIMLGAASTKAAAADCLEQPNLREANGHWYYRVDRSTHQRCWYLKQEPQPDGPAASEAKSTLASLPSSIATFLMGRRTSPSTGSQQDVATAEAPPEPISGPTASKKSVSPTNNHRLTSNERADSAPRFRKQVEHTDQQRELDSVQREQLFEDFLRWSTQRQ
jgi:hypothetical protein